MGVMAAPTASGIVTSKLKRRIVVVGKFPPIQGGTSSSTFWATVALATAGFEVHVVTNSDQISPTFRQRLLTADKHFVSNELRDLGIFVHQVNPVRDGEYIPWAQPFLTAMLGRLLSLTNDISPECLLGWYLEPYGLAAAIAGSLRGIPVAFRHAGSDFGRLLKHQELRHSYDWALKSCSCVVASRSHLGYLSDLAISSDKLCMSDAPRLPAPFLKPTFGFEMADYEGEFHPWFIEARLGMAPPKSLVVHNEKRINIGLFGKIGTFKSTEQIVEALGKLASDGIDFELQSAVTGHRHHLKSFFTSIIKQPSLLERTTFLPPLPPWRMPGFLKQLDCVLYLENHFPIENHSPLIPREVLSSGACLICSREIANKFRYRESLEHAKNVVIVERPDSTECVVESLRLLLQNPENIRLIGRHGQYLSHFIENEKQHEHPALAWIQHAIKNYSNAAPARLSAFSKCDGSVERPPSIS